MRSSPDYQVSTQLERLRRFSDLFKDIHQTSSRTYQASVRLGFLFASIVRVTKASRSVELLAHECCVEEILLVAKTLIEVVVDGAYLQHANDFEIDRYLYSDLHGVSQETAQLRQSMIVAVPSPRLPSLKQRAITMVRALFRQEEIHSWSTKTLMERAEISDRRSGVPIMGLLVGTTRSRAQAASRNTFSSLAPYLNPTQSMASSPSNERQKALAEALFAVNLILMAFSVYLNTFLSLKIDDAIEAAGSALAEPCTIAPS